MTLLNDPAAVRCRWQSRYMRMAKDRPGRVTLLVLLVVATHFVASQQGVLPAIPRQLVEHPSVFELYLGAAAVLALVAGFAGVAIVFAMTPHISVLQRVRRQGGDRLRANWISLVATPVMTSLAFLTAAAVFFAGEPRAAGWIFEISALLTLGSAARLIWIFALLVRLDIDHEVPAPKQALELVNEANQRPSASG